MLRRFCLFAAVLAACALPSCAQEANSGISIPVTASFGAMDSQRLRSEDPDAARAAAGFRVMFYPTVKLGDHWFAYSAIQVSLKPYFYYDAFDPDRQLRTSVIQGFVGYSLHTGKATVVFKAGQLTSAFGSFPIRYDDAENPLLDQPLTYITNLPLHKDSLPWTVGDLIPSTYGGEPAAYGAPNSSPGLTPVTLYGLPGIQAEISVQKLDARLQLTNGSPANPQGWKISRQYAQFAGGAGYTVRQGLRFGVSAFSGPYLDRSVVWDLPAATTVRDFPATGVGIDGQWAHGHWSVNGEWHRLRFDEPYFVVSPAFQSGYVEAKRILSPRFYVAGRTGWLKTGHVVDNSGGWAPEFAPALKSYEVAGGFWMNHRQLLKVSYEWLASEGTPGSRLNVLGFEFVTRFNLPSLPF